MSCEGQRMRAATRISKRDRRPFRPCLRAFAGLGPPQGPPITLGRSLAGLDGLLVRFPDVVGARGRDQ